MRCHRGFELRGALEMRDRVAKSRLVQSDATQVLMKPGVVRVGADSCVELPLRIGVSVRKERRNAFTSILCARGGTQDDDAHHDESRHLHHSSSATLQE
jgi:hypothetical protein